MARANRSIVNSKPKPFLSTWKTDNLSQTSSAANQIVLPLTSSGLYNFMVYWGDNTSSSISSALQPEVTHSYATAGTYNVTMSGYIKGWSFNNGRDRRKIIDISQWGGLKLSAQGSQFYGCDALTLNNISDTPYLYSKNLNPTVSASMAAMFRSCSLLVSISRANEWDTNQVGFMQQIFYGAYRYNQNIGNWNTSNATNMANIFAAPNLNFTHSFNNGGSDSIKNWDTSKVTNFSQMFIYNSYFNQPIGSWNVSSGSNFQWMFSFSRDFNQPLNTWDTSNATIMFGMFQSASTFNQPLNNWNTSKVTDMAQMFYTARAFNQDVGSWNTSNVTTMAFMFGFDSRTGSFNNGGADTLKNWNTSKVTTMQQMFGQQPYFNQNIGTWDVSNVTTTYGMFSLNSTGYGTSSFNNGDSPSINNWNTSNITNMAYMFAAQTNFNQPIGNWNTSKVTDMQYMFNVPSNPKFDNGKFNQPIGGWDMSKVTNTQYMLNGQYLFNQDIGNWNLSKVTNAQGMLKMLATPYSASLFNNSGSDSIKNWNLTSSTNMASMFENAYAFNQPLSNWNVSSMTTATSFMGAKSNTNYSTANYDALLIGWASRPVKPNVSISFNNINYTIAASASRAILVSAPNNWTIQDGGQI